MGPYGRDVCLGSERKENVNNQGIINVHILYDSYLVKKYSVKPSFYQKREISPTYFSVMYTQRFYRSITIFPYKGNKALFRDSNIEGGDQFRG